MTLIRCSFGSFVLLCLLGQPQAQAQPSDAGVAPTEQPAEPPPTAAAPEPPPEQLSAAEPVEAPATVIAPPEASEPEPEPASEYSARAQADRTGASETPRYGTGSKQGVPLEEQAATVSVIESATLRVRGVNNLDEALTLTPGVTPTWQYGGSAINQWAPNPQVTPGPGREVLCTLKLQL